MRRIGLTIGPVFLLTLVTSGCAPRAASRAPTLLRDGEQAFYRGDYAQADRQLSTFLGESSVGPEATRARYVRGMARALLGDRQHAYDDLRRATHAVDNPAITWQPYAVLGVMYFEDGRWATAIDVLGAAVARMPGAPPQDALLYRIGLCQERTGQWHAARASYQRIVNVHSRGPYYADAKRRLALDAQHFAVQCGVFSKEANAQRLVADLRGRGLDAYIRREPRDGVDYHVVLYGQFGTYEEAIQALARARGYVPAAVLWP